MSERATVWTDEADARLRAYLATPGRHIPTGLGTKDAACSVGAINLALTGELSDDIPGCMSRVIGHWIVVTQDKMPDELRNSEGWRALLPLAAGTGREREAARLRVVMNWMWSVLARAQPVADEHGFGGAWRAMCEQRTKDAGRSAARATGPAATAARATAYAAATAAATAAANAAANAAAYAAAKAAARAAARATGPAATAAANAAANAAAGSRAAVWAEIDPVSVLRAMIAA
ncbi:hypothetical protein [Candidatus Palauibacter sp.]|uniref:hypothetical protein n=1 Tax=Candidatus Palauibacter sp. TaxID=3101350 RepID=UPI003CC6CB8C